MIVNWNTRDLLERCLVSVDVPVPGLTTDVVVVDNASTDGSQEMVRQKFPDVRLIENSTNVGFAHANNQGIREGNAAMVLLLNADAQLQQSALEHLVHFLQANPEATAVGPRIIHPDGSLQISCYPTPTLLREFWRLFHLDALIPLGSYPMSRWDPACPRMVDVLLGACILVRREALERIGLLNEAYFMYSEDLDLCYRLRKVGGKIFWHPVAEIIHHGGQSTRQVSRQMFLRLYHSKLAFFRIYYGGLSASLYRVILLAASFARLAFSPLLALFSSRDHDQDTELAHNYRQLIRTLLS